MIIASITLLSALCLSVLSVPRIAGLIQLISRDSGTLLYDVTQSVLVIGWVLNGLLLFVLAALLLTRRRSALVPAVAVLISTGTALLVVSMGPGVLRGFWYSLFRPPLDLLESVMFYLCTGPPILALLPSTLRALPPKPVKATPWSPYGGSTGY
ncbi:MULTISPECIES: hypothetical protein [unclassified Actinopolyspora]|uniref:hypothetical protein n=1 Tax=Actinopolyspora TaxID=1849 RepID=UPI0013F60922|nr:MULTISPECIES: hypothetical protein [unclassified Actinopolyspora]NHD16647.1 hypothetical protein [Actinopolyspora sp. BKK2]NHE75490.1 hypothetical protein [Actinopolyspora sp. BKK1]